MEGNTALIMYHFGNTVTCDMADGEIVAMQHVVYWTLGTGHRYSGGNIQIIRIGHLNWKLCLIFLLTQDKYFCIYKKARQHFFRNDAGSVSSVSAEWTVYTRAFNKPSRSSGEGFRLLLRHLLAHLQCMQWRIYYTEKVNRRLKQEVYIWNWDDCMLRS